MPPQAPNDTALGAEAAAEALADAAKADGVPPTEPLPPQSPR
jgi:hypothetical protein